MSGSCPECGASLPDGQSCRALFDATQLAELERAEYFAVHHLSVPSYLLQHKGYSREGWLATRELLRHFVEEKLSPAAARRRAGALTGKGKRQWSFTRGAKLPGVDDVRWSRTVADLRLDTAEHYREDVRRWAESVLRDSEALG